MSWEAFLDGRVSLFSGDVLSGLASMASDSVDCVVTSPPYWNLRDYGCEGQIGLEPTLGEHLQVMVGVFREVRRVLKPTGTVWLNYGDTYASKPNGTPAAIAKARGRDDRSFRDKPGSTIGLVGGGYAGVLKPKDLCMLPNRLAIALQDDGWWVRSEIVWAKSNPMPDSAKDRPSVAFEKVWLLSKTGSYFYDSESVRQPSAKRGSAGHLKSGQNSRIHMRQVPREAGRRRQDGNEASAYSESRGLRNYEPAPLAVWEFATSPFRDAHFATFPPELAARAIRAGCPAGGLVLDPFGGAGTTALVAARLGRRSALIELNADYGRMARDRIEAEWRCGRPREVTTAGPLFDAQVGA